MSDYLSFSFKFTGTRHHAGRKVSRNIAFKVLVDDTCTAAIIATVCALRFGDSLTGAAAGGVRLDKEVSLSVVGIADAKQERVNSMVGEALTLLADAGVITAPDACKVVKGSLSVGLRIAPNLYNEAVVNNW